MTVIHGGNGDGGEEVIQERFLCVLWNGLFSEEGDADT